MPRGCVGQRSHLGPLSLPGTAIVRQDCPNGKASGSVALRVGMAHPQEVSTGWALRSSTFWPLDASSILRLPFLPDGFHEQEGCKGGRESMANGYLPCGGMHPPGFRPSQCLLDWPNCRLEMRYGRCGSVVLFRTKRLVERHGNHTFTEVLGRVKCRRCGVSPESVSLCAGLRTRHGGPPADWAIELVAPLRRGKVRGWATTASGKAKTGSHIPA